MDAICRHKRVYRLLMLGLDDAGKTTILYKLKCKRIVETMTTVGFNHETITSKICTLDIREFGGKAKIRWLWYRYCHDIHGLIFVIDVNDRCRFEEAEELLRRLLKTPQLEDARLLIFANKKDLVHSVSQDDIAQQLNLCQWPNRQWHISVISATQDSADHIYSEMDWLIHRLANKR